MPYLRMTNNKNLATLIDRAEALIDVGNGDGIETSAVNLKRSMPSLSLRGAATFARRSPQITVQVVQRS